MAMALAVAMRLQQPLGADHPEHGTYCYQSIRTHDKERASATCVSVHDGVFSRIWSDESESARSRQSPSETLNGHVMAYGEFLHSVDLFGARSLSEAKERIKAYIKENPGVGAKDQWIRGVGWDQNIHGRMPTAAGIENDADLRSTYVMLDRIDVHCIWVSQSVLALLPAEYPRHARRRNHPRPRPGRLLRQCNQPRHEALAQARRQKQSRCRENRHRQAQSGRTSRHPRRQFPYPKTSAYTATWPTRPTGHSESTEYSMFECRQRNTFCPSETQKIQRNAIDALVEALKQQCPQATTDADLAACQRTHRFRIEHAQTIHPHDQVNMHALGSMPSIHPTHATSDMEYALERLGPERTDNEAYRMRSLLDIHPMLGSEFPVEPPNPFHSIYAAVARKNPGTGRGVDGSHRGWHTDEALTLDQALWGFTGATAYGAFLEGRAGVIKEGAFADWLVLDEPIESLDSEKLRALQVRETWVAGKKVYQRDG